MKIKTLNVVKVNHSYFFAEMNGNICDNSIILHIWILVQMENEITFYYSILCPTKGLFKLGVRGWYKATFCFCWKLKSSFYPFSWFSESDIFHLFIHVRSTFLFSLQSSLAKWYYEDLRVTTSFCKWEFKPLRLKKKKKKKEFAPIFVLNKLM